MAILVSDLLRKLDAIPKSVLEDIKSEIKVEYDREAQNHDSFDEYSGADMMRLDFV